MKDNNPIDSLKKAKYPELVKLLEKYEEDEEAQRIIVREYSRSNFEFFCEFFFKEHVTNEFTRLHKDFFKWATDNERGIKKLIIAARGSSKTTMICLFYVFHRICFGTEKYILILSSTKPLATAKTKDIVEEIERNENLCYVFGIKFKDKRRSSERFSVLSDYGETFIHSQGFGSQIRGAKKGSDRPTLMICDDITHGEHVFSEEQRDKSRRQFRADIQMAESPKTNFIIIGTLLHRNDLLSELFESPIWDGEKYPAIEKWPDNQVLWEQWKSIMINRDDPDSLRKADEFYEKNKREMDKGSRVLWEGREPLIFLMKKRLDIGSRVFDCEKQLNPYSFAQSLFTDIQWFVDVFQGGKRGILIEKSGEFLPLDDSRWQTYYALDPATGEKNPKAQKLSDSSRIVVYRDQITGRVFVFRDKTNRDGPSRIIREMYEWNKEFNFTRMAVEENLFRDLFGEMVDLTRYKIDTESGGVTERLPIFGIWQRQDKEQRIYGIEPRVFNGKILFNKNLSHVAKTQLQDYPVCEKNDFLDAVEIANKITSIGESALMRLNL